MWKLEKNSDFWAKMQCAWLCSVIAETSEQVMSSLGLLLHFPLCVISQGLGLVVVSGAALTLRQAVGSRVPRL